MRKTMIKYGSKATDIVLQKEGFIRITTVNAKASWRRDFIEGKEVTQVLEQSLKFPKGHTLVNTKLLHLQNPCQRVLRHARKM
jgi:hypothetical protein